MNLQYAIPCRRVEELADGTSLLIGVESSAFIVTEFPHSILFATLICVTQTAHESAAGIERTMLIRVLGPDLEPRSPTMSYLVDSKRHPDLPAGWDQRTLIPGVINFEATGAGTHSLEVHLNGGSLSVPLLVRQLATAS